MTKIRASSLCDLTTPWALIEHLYFGAVAWCGKNANKQLVDKKIHVGCSENIWVSCVKTPSGVEKTRGTVWGLENHVVRVLKN